VFLTPCFGLQIPLFFPRMSQKISASPPRFSVCPLNRGQIKWAHSWVSTTSKFVCLTTISGFLFQVYQFFSCIHRVSFNQSPRPYFGPKFGFVFQDNIFCGGVYNLFFLTIHGVGGFSLVRGEGKLAMVRME